ncbi:hydrogenase nickel incorporation protein HypB [Natronobacterium gregoryi]|uniref:Hydrogenase accessory protein HypB n=2 Tax=Natronobacterium gregoryi TaxID=44930 RepID=L0AHR3_NATGS|nr:hydrogenase nickel incorporation protein HypB [Natronobacterium gregoryi]AFZ73346.1 hydrogenase accessory protein HypB [Natronobacterium gregoryi SP2]PLK18786.1 hydrogenase accessory protein HypB [Natronobacterium gregoryi SP2]SFJ63876.1 hydrogenase nickel incorporation protein HypB [Natronobacterium gregoryi]
MYNRTTHPLTRALNRLFDVGPIRLHRFGHDHDHEESTTDIEADVLAAVRERAGEVHERLAHDHGVYGVEFAGSTGGGKTLLIERLIERAPEDEQLGVVVGDVAGEDDAKRLRDHGVAVENVNTGKECHLDPTLVDEAIESFDLETLDTLYLENVGNMVCPADFPLGATRRVLVVSTTEGDDVVRKHPMLVQSADVVVINKVDIADAVGTDVDVIRSDVEDVAPGTSVVETNAQSGEGIAALEAELEGEHDHHQ